MGNRASLIFYLICTTAWRKKERKGEHQRTIAPPHPPPKKNGFLCMERCKSLGSLKSFLLYASQLSGASILCFTHPELPWAYVGRCQWLPDHKYSSGVSLGLRNSHWRTAIADHCDTMTSFFTDMTGNTPFLMVHKRRLRRKAGYLPKVNPHKWNKENIRTLWCVQTTGTLWWCVRTWDYVVDLASPCWIYRIRKSQLRPNQLEEIDKFPRAINCATSFMIREETTAYPNHTGFNYLCQCLLEPDGTISSSSSPQVLESCDQADSIQTSGFSSSYHQEAVGRPLPHLYRTSSLGIHSREKKERHYPDRDCDLELNLS